MCYIYICLDLATRSRVLVTCSVSEVRIEAYVILNNCIYIRSVGGPTTAHAKSRDVDHGEWGGAIIEYGDREVRIAVVGVVRGDPCTPPLHRVMSQNMCICM